MPIVGGLDIHRKQITFDYLDAETGEVKRGQVTPSPTRKAPPDPKPPDPRGQVSYVLGCLPISAIRAGVDRQLGESERRKTSSSHSPSGSRAMWLPRHTSPRSAM